MVTHILTNNADNENFHNDDVLYGLDGNDTLVNLSVGTNPSFLYGGQGNDSLDQR